MPTPHGRDLAFLLLILAGPLPLGLAVAAGARGLTHRLLPCRRKMFRDHRRTLAEIDLRTIYLRDLTILGCTFQDDAVFENLIGYIVIGTCLMSGAALTRVAVHRIGRPHHGLTLALHRADQLGQPRLDLVMAVAGDQRHPPRHPAGEGRTRPVSELETAVAALPLEERPLRVLIV